jgi:hypothetical protein
LPSRPRRFVDQNLQLSGLLFEFGPFTVCEERDKAGQSEANENLGHRKSISREAMKNQIKGDRVVGSRNILYDCYACYAN